MKVHTRFLNFIVKEWLLVAATVGFIGTSLYLQRIPSFSITEFEILFILAVLFITVKGIEQSGLLARLSQSVEKGKYIPLKLVVVTFFLSMIVTNDVALIVVVPLTLALNTTRKDILVILEALAANAGSALTPVGNPQNLFIYWFYKLDAASFFTTILPFSGVFLILLIIAALLVKTSNINAAEVETIPVKKSVFVYGFLLLIVVLAVLHVLPIHVGFIVVAYAIFVDRNSLRIDYPLLLTFLVFFGLAANIQAIFAADLGNSSHIFIVSALLSQVISNVPSALLYAKFTTQWKALLWGTNVGGFGSLVGSLANLIAYKFYVVNEETNDTAAFTTKFLVFGYLAFAIGICVYWLLERTI